MLTKNKTTRIFLKPDEISKHLICSICHQVFDNPNRLACGHTFCYLCIQEWASMCKTCPLCKNTVKNRKPEKDLIAASIIDDLRSKCSHLNCKWQGVYCMLKKHQRICQNKPRKSFQEIKYNQNEIVVQLQDSDKQEIQQKYGKKKVKLDNDHYEQQKEAELHLKKQDRTNQNQSNQSISTNSMQLNIQPNFLQMNQLNSRNQRNSSPSKSLSRRSSSSSMSSNPFDHEIPQRNLPKRNQIIIIDSSGDDELYNNDKQSGEMSFSVNDHNNDNNNNDENKNIMVQISSILKYTPQYEFRRRCINRQKYR